MTFKISLLIFSAAALLASCIKTKDIITADIDPTVAEATHKLKYFINTDPATPHAAEVSLFEYDALGRVSKYSEMAQDSAGTTVTIPDAVYLNFIYNGATERPAKAVITYTPSVPYTDSALYTYDASGRITKEQAYDGSIHAVASENTYEYVGSSKIASQKFERNPSGTMILKYRDTFLLDAGGRILELHSQYISLPGISKTTYAYDNKINPFSRLNIFKHLISPTGQNDMYLFLRAPSNQIRTVDTYTGSADETVRTFSFIYDADNYPVSAVDMLNIPSSGIETFGVRYKYY